jgi:iron-sulfur cluster repair protein YtfE (RIC family)
MSADILSMLEIEHRQVERVLSALAQVDDPKERERLVRDLAKSLSLHMQFEEEHVYPLMQQVNGELAEEADVEHQLVREGLSNVTEFVAAPGFGAALEMLTAGISHHVHEEEHEAFPQLRKHYDAQRLQSLGRTLIEQKRAAGTLVPPNASKEELLELASQQGIEGRSAMTKEQLRESLLAG